MDGLKWNYPSFKRTLARSWMPELQNHTITMHRISCFFLDQNRYDIHWLPKKQKPNARHPNFLPTSLKTADLCQDKNAFTFSTCFLTTL